MQFRSNSAISNGPATGADCRRELTAGMGFLRRIRRQPLDLIAHALCVRAICLSSQPRSEPTARRIASAGQAIRKILGSLFHQIEMNGRRDSPAVPCGRVSKRSAGIAHSFFCKPTARYEIQFEFEYACGLFRIGPVKIPVQIYVSDPLSGRLVFSALPVSLLASSHSACLGARL